MQLGPLVQSTPAAVHCPRVQLLWTVDQGKAANLAGVADADLKGRLKALLKLLGLRSTATKVCTRGGHFPYILPIQYG